jgi:ribosome maturation factor RimP
MEEFPRKCLTQNVFTTSLKTAGAMGSVALAKAIQSFETISEERIQQMVSNGEQVFNNLKAQVLGSCNAPNYRNVNEDELIKQLMCQQVNKGRLTEKTLQSLAAILNANNYYAMPKQAYEKEKQAAANAVLATAAGTAVSSAIVDAGMNALKSATNETSTKMRDAIVAKPTPGQDPSQVFGVSLATTAPIALGAAVGTAAFGIAMYKKLNQTIPKEYIPDLNTLSTLIAEKRKLLKDNEPSYDNCKKTTTRQVILEIQQSFSSQTQDSISDYQSNIITVPMTLYKIDFNFDAGTLSDGIKGKTKRNTFKKQIENYCNKDLPENMQELKKRIDDSEALIQRVFNAYKIDINESETYLYNLSPDVTPIIDNLILQQISTEEIQQASQRLNAAIEEARRKTETYNNPPGLLNLGSPGANKALYTTAQCIGDQCAKVSQKASQAAQKTKSLFGYGGKKHRKSRRVRKRKTQKRIRKTYRHK